MLLVMVATTSHQQLQLERAREVEQQLITEMQQLTREKEQVTREKEQVTREKEQVTREKEQVCSSLAACCPLHVLYDWYVGRSIRSRFG